MTMKSYSLSRRSLLGAAAMGTAAFATVAHAEETSAIKGSTLTEAARSLPLDTDADVIVCGAGPAGVTAAISATRAGARVRLFEAHGSLGGVWTSSLLGYLLDFNKPGFNRELVARLRKRDAVLGGGMNALKYHPEDMKVLLEEMCLEAGVRMQLHTRTAATYREGRQLRAIITESKSGRQAWGASVFIDTTGDGDLGAQAGCQFEMGMNKACPCQPMSLNVLLTVKDAAALKGIIHGTAKGLKTAKIAFRDEIRRAGLDPSYGWPTLFRIRDNLLLAMMNHEYGVDATDAAAVTQASVRARAELHHIVRALGKLGGPWEGLQIVATAEQIGIRDGRRIIGRYYVNKQDVINGASHDDGVVRVNFPVDVHGLTPDSAPASHEGIKVSPYQIPLRALIARDVDGLMMAGRCISGDFLSHASYRVTGNAVAMGEAAGVVAAVSATTNRQPHDVPWSEARLAIEKVRQSQT